MPDNLYPDDSIPERPELDDTDIKSLSEGETDTAPLPPLWQAYAMDTRNNRPAGVYIGCLAGPKELCIEWLEATSPGWLEDFETGRAALRTVNVWHITPEKIAADRAAYQERIGKG